VHYSVEDIIIYLICTYVVFFLDVDFVWQDAERKTRRMDKKIGCVVRKIKYGGMEGEDNKNVLYVTCACIT